MATEDVRDIEQRVQAELDELAETLKLPQSLIDRLVAVAEKLQYTEAARGSIELRPTSTGSDSDDGVSGSAGNSACEIDMEKCGKRLGNSKPTRDCAATGSSCIQHSKLKFEAGKSKIVALLKTEFGLHGARGSARFLKDKYRKSQYKYELGVNVFKEECEEGEGDEKTTTFEYAVHDLFSTFIQEKTAEEVVEKLKQVQETLKVLWNACQFMHGDMKAEQILIDKQSRQPLLNDFDKSSFTLTYENRYAVRIRPSMGYDLPPPFKQLAEGFAQRGLQLGPLAFNPQMQARASVCPLQLNHEFDMACLFASVLLRFPLKQNSTLRESRDMIRIFKGGSNGSI